MKLGRGLPFPFWRPRTPKGTGDGRELHRVGRASIHLEAPTGEEIQRGFAAVAASHSSSRISSIVGYALRTLPNLCQVPARVRFLSVEPLLEGLRPLDLNGIQWVIVGGESGPDARPMRPEWALSVRDQCEATGAAFLFKQWGAWGPDGVRRDKKANGRLLAGRLWDQRPELSGTLL